LEARGRVEEPVFVDREVFRSPVVTVGEFQCTVNHPDFEDSGPIKQDCFVFPRLAVSIQHEHARAFVANPNVVTFAGIGAAAAGPFGWSRAASDPSAYLSQREIVDSVRQIGESAAVDAAEIEERVILLLDRTVRTAVEPSELASASRYRRTTRDAIHEIEILLSARWHESWQLSDLAGRAGLSPFHLCRAFRRLTGCTLHQYRMRLRLRAALDEMRRTPRSLVDIALDAGFCSHSHFTSAFRREFGVLPSELRAPFARS
jgi:AraC-like DNA-binding protein